jgi:hypothetical protein
VNIVSGEELSYINTLIQTDTGGLPGSEIKSSTTTTTIPDTCPIVTSIISN